MDFDLQAHTILLAVGGSRSYGIHTSTSDVDVKGVAIPPAPYLHGYLKRFEQADSPSHLVPFVPLMNEEERQAIAATKLEGSIYELRKFIGLAVDANPNILDVLFCRDAEVRLATPLGEKLRAARELFLSAKARHTFSGYAASQLKRIKGHRQWLIQPPDHKPTRSEFGLPEHTLIPADQLAAAAAAIRKQVDRWELDLSGLPDAEILHLQERVSSMLAEITTSLGLHSSDDTRWLAAARTIGLDDNLVLVMQREREYEAAARHFKQYEEWKRNRNPARAELEAKHGYDCHLDDTEFLTEAGWKRYDDITEDDKLATVYIGETNTVHRWGTIEYQAYTERFDGTFNGNLYHFTGHHTDIMVTPNHRMLHRPVEKNTRVKHEWTLGEAASLPNYFEVMRSIVPKTKTFGTNNVFDGLPVPSHTYMMLMGWFLSDGCLQFSENGEVKSIRISQKKGGKLAWSMSRFVGDHGDKVSCSLYEYERPPNAANPASIVEMVLDIRDRTLRERLYADCGARKEKRVPRWAFGLSKRLMEKLFDGMMAGDGTTRDTSLQSLVYYSSLPGLADDVHELAVLCGWETSKWGPYHTPNELSADLRMWHIHVNKEAEPFKEMARSKNIEKVPVTGARIVCFTVPNGTLVTRRNGRVSFHGNSKHGAHLVRLLRMGKEILLTGKVNVWRGPDGGPGDAQELLSIRQGAWSYDQLVEWAEQQDQELETIYRDRKYVVPKAPERDAIDKLCVELVETALSGK